MNVTDWLLASDPSIRWQAMRDLTDAPPDEVAAERARVAREGWGAGILAAQETDRWITLRALRTLRWAGRWEPAAETASA